MQCAAFNDRPVVAGNSFKWTTFHGGGRLLAWRARCYCSQILFSSVKQRLWSLPGSNPCELSCLALGHNFYYNFGRVLDGTSCDQEPGGLCVNGRCLVSGRCFLKKAPQV